MDICSYFERALRAYYEKPGGNPTEAASNRTWLPIEHLYQRIRTQGSGSEELALFETITSLEPRKQTVARLSDDDFDAVYAHAGTMSRDFPLTDSRRLTLHRYDELPKGEVLAANGSPSTKNTTLLQAIVADLLVHRALSERPVPPIIVASSTNDQTLASIVDAFTKEVKQTQGNSVFRRWLPNIALDPDGKGYKIDDKRPLRSLCIDASSNARSEEANGKGCPLDDLSCGADGLYRLCIDPAYGNVAKRVYCQQASAYLGKAYTSPGAAMGAVRTLLRQVDEWRGDLAEAVARGVDPTECQELVESLARHGAVDAKGMPIPPEACKDLVSLDKALDTTVRPLEFWLAMHLFEGMWLTVKKLGDTPEKTELNSYEIDEVCACRRQMATLMPLTAMTMHRLPDQFMFGSIDLLIVSDAEQIAMPVGAAAFSLAQRAVVMGDAGKRSPTPNLDPQTDFATSSVMAAAQAACPWTYEEVYGLPS